MEEHCSIKTEKTAYQSPRFPLSDLNSTLNKKNLNKLLTDITNTFF